MVSSRVAAAFASHHDPVLRALRRHGVPESDIDDVAQQVFCVLAARLDDVPAEKESAFLHAVAVRLSRYLVRRRASRREVFDDDLLDGMSSSLPPLDEQLDHARSWAALEGAIDDLPPPLRDVLMLHDLDRLTMAEIAKAKSLPPGTVASRLRRARAALSRVAAAAIALIALLLRRRVALAAVVPAIAGLFLLQQDETVIMLPPASQPRAAVHVPAMTFEPASVKTRAPAAAVPATSPRPAVAVVVEDELGLLVRARRALAAGEIDAARQALADRESHYPSGAYAMESAALWIEVLVAHGELDRARAAVGRFSARYPGSPYEQRLHALVP